jgi:FHA domain-containing protein
MSETRKQGGPPAPPAPAAGRARMFDRSPSELKEVIAAERIGQPFLIWRDDGGHQRILPLNSTTWRVTIGRDPEADVSLAGDAEVSRAHALIERVGQEWTFVDDGLSRNGSFINQTRVLGRRRLVDHDRILCGNSEITFREPVVKTGDSTVSSRDLAPVLPLSPMQRKVLIALCRPVQASDTATPATNRQIAEEVHLTVDAVKAHLRVLFERYGLGDLPQNEKRARLVATVLLSGVLAAKEF